MSPELDAFLAAEDLDELLKARRRLDALAPEDDGGFALIGHPDSTVRHNLRAWLFRAFQGTGAGPLAEAGRESGINEAIIQQIVAEFTELQASHVQT